MAKEKEREIKQIKAPPQALSALYSNVTFLSSSEDIIVIDFGFYAPTYNDADNHLEDQHIARIVMQWDEAQDFADSLREVIVEHNKEVKKGKGK